MYYRINETGELIAVHHDGSDVLVGRVAFGRERRLAIEPGQTLRGCDLRQIAQAIDYYHGPAAAGEDD